jgi:hypothetical protein
LIYTNYEGGGIDLGGDDDGDGDVAVDVNEDSSPHAKVVLVAMMVSIFPQRWPWSNRIFPLPTKKRTFISAAPQKICEKLGVGFCTVRRSYKKKKERRCSWGWGVGPSMPLGSW